MGFIKAILIFALNITILVVAIRFVSLLLERVGFFRAMERLFGKRSDEKGDVIIVEANKSEGENDEQERSE